MCIKFRPLGNADQATRVAWRDLIADTTSVLLSSPFRLKTSSVFWRAADRFEDCRQQD